jgi:hypothetical protein
VPVGKRVERVHLKKQSQFVEVQIVVKSILTMVYGDMGEWVQQKNKANSKPNRQERIAGQV